jgi:hypothetical protein
VRRSSTLALAAAAIIAVPPAPAGAAHLEPIALTAAGADSGRLPFARWAPDYPIVNIRVSTRSGAAADLHRVQTGFYGREDDGTEPFWRGEDDRLVPGVYYTSVQGDAPGHGGSPWSPATLFRVPARRREWTGPTSQGRYLRFTRSRSGALRGLAFSVYAPGCRTHATLSLPGSIRVRRDGTFSGRGTGTSKRFVGTARIRIRGRVRRGFARGAIRVDDLFEGCSSGRIRWSARRR